ncbi:DUF1573 domain-containing protein [Flammeovirgaceae bacterium SG7u.111]|nr:DUF1573 domain-containing protein [Flammeovirgaceae bacterium SG7u.132]WPO37112.1 DUF1573 domain-containing protein [Flammeovirgaceae bacterium SG7u.111]
MKALLLLLSLFGFGTALAQGNLVFEITEHNFGEVREGELAEKVFKFINTGDIPVVIKDVWASCGCTTPEWPKEPILPGDSSEIAVVFNSTGRPGTFYKTISIASNALEPISKLIIRGQVIRPTDPAKPQGGNNSASLELGEKSYNFGKIQVGDKLVRNVFVKNTSERSVFIEGLQSECKCVRIKGGGKFIKAQEEVEIELIFTPRSIVVTPILINFQTNRSGAITYELKGEVVKSLIEKSTVRESELYDF